MIYWGKPIIARLQHININWVTYNNRQPYSFARPWMITLPVPLGSQG